MSTNGIRHFNVRGATAAVLAGAATLALAAGVSAAPPSGSSGSGSGSSGTGSGSGSGPAAPPTQQCNQSTKSGGSGVTETAHHLGRPGPAAFVLSYETFAIPDQIEVFYQGARVHNTGYIGDNINEGTGSAVINIPAGTATTVAVRVTGPGGTDWNYTVHCPR
ncbi:hypothetical protein NONI108955_43355 [Nocardia ninae]|uniref:Uncharacterized protein n=1 Tax=Nocardia ninae NBRC 108245 TaxID=1210091 RepID=A0A511MAZ6_9NOCA|nr:hypothetical protein [Nocardia ninae]GEM37367.1 hypothetical protein NN4_18860 [Nocardia ninae NBRC 108245]